MATNGKFKLFVKSSPKRPWGFLGEFLYDDSSRRKRDRRAQVLERVRNARMLWTYNYYVYYNASFCIEDWATDFAVPKHIEGVKRERIGLKRRVPFKKAA